MSEILSILTIFQFSGFWLLIFLGRWSMVLGWRDMIRSKIFRQKHEFVSADARRFSTTDPRTYEMLDSKTPALNISSPDRILSPGQAHPLRSSPMTPEPDSKNDYYSPNHKYPIRTHDAISPQSPAPAYNNSPNAPQNYNYYPGNWPVTHSRPNYPPGTAMSTDYK